MRKVVDTAGTKSVDMGEVQSGKTRLVLHTHGICWSLFFIRSYC